MIRGWRCRRSLEIAEACQAVGVAVGDLENAFLFVFGWLGCVYFQNGFVFRSKSGDGFAEVQNGPRSQDPGLGFVGFSIKESA